MLCWSRTSLRNVDIGGPRGSGISGMKLERVICSETDSTVNLLRLFTILGMCNQARALSISQMKHPRNDLLAIPIFIFFIVP